MFIHLNIHTNYSKMYSATTFRDYLKKCKALKMEYLAVTEVNGLWGFIHFTHLAKEYGIQPIAGSNIITENHESVLLVKNQNGFTNLCKILSAQHLNPDFSLITILTKYHSGLFILSHQKHTLEQLSKLIPAKQLFIELRPGVDEISIKQWGKSLQLKSVATGDVYFKHKENVRTHQILRAIHHNTTLSRLEKNNCKTANHWFRSTEDMHTLFPNSENAIKNSYVIAKNCKTNWNFNNTIFPNIGKGGSKTLHPNQTLRILTFEGDNIIKI